MALRIIESADLRWAETIRPVRTDDFEQRANQAERLTGLVGVPEINERVLQLLLDPWDTAVTYRTALALLARHDHAGVELVLRADAQADDDTSQWLGEALREFRDGSLGQDDDFLLRSLLGFAAGPDEQLRPLAQDLIDWLDL